MSGAPRARSSAPLLAVAAGALFALTVAPFDGGWIVVVVGLACLLAAVEEAGTGLGAAACGSLAGLTMAIAIDYGLLRFDTGLFVLGVGLVSLTMGAVTLAWAACRRRVLPPALRVLVFAALWVLGEWVCITAGVPWSSALTQAAHPRFTQLAGVLGMLGVSFLVVVVGVSAYEPISWLRARRLPDRWLEVPLMAALLLGANLAYGSWVLSRPAPSPTVRIAAVQPLMPSAYYYFQGLNPAYRDTLRSVVEGLTREAARQHPDLLFWSEGGNGQFNFRIPALRRELADLATESRSTLLAASYDVDEDGRLFNSVFSLAADGRLLGRYDKVELAPVGEGQFAPGAGFTPLRTPLGAVGSMICFESCFSGPARALAGAGAQLLSVTTSDAAFGETSLPLMHARFAIFRALENGRYLVQAANTGPSFIVTPRGEVAAELPAFVRGVLTGAVAMRSQSTVYTRCGDWPLLAVLVAILAASLGCARRPAPGVTSRTGWRAWSLAAAAAAGMGAVLAALSLAVVGGRGTAAGWAAVPARFFAQAAADVAPETVRAQLQSRDNSCGLAALAYLMSYLGMPTREGELLSVARLGADGISMADLAVVARQRGLLAWGELQNFDALRETPKPVIAHIRDDHYVVVLSVGRQGVDCFDPSQGYVRIPQVDFRKVWRGYALVVRFPHLQDFSP